VKTNHPSAAQKDDLDPSEWDFRKEKVPTSEIETCFIYEHGRELAKRSRRIKKLLAKWKAGHGTSQESPQYKESSRAYFEAVDLLTECFDAAVTLSADFPDTTWQQLDKEWRSRVIDGVNTGRLNVPDAPLAIKLLTDPGASPAKGFKAFQALHWFFRNLDRIQYGFVAIDWNYPNAAIKRAFEKWLSQRRAARKGRGSTKTKYKPKGRGGFRDRLNRLAALRLLKHYGARGLVKDPRDPRSRIKFADAPYQNLSDLYEAKAKAERLVTGLLSIIDGS
jgi:hypothetical protein